MKIAIVIPIKARGCGKSRLGGVLDDRDRETLVSAMLDHVVGIATGLPDADVRLLQPPPGRRLAGVGHAHDPGSGLNAALAGVLAAALDDDTRRLVILPADLPLLRREDVARLIDGADDEMMIAPDRSRRGTNGLGLPLPRAASFRFRFGADSFAAHRAQAPGLALRIARIDAEGLGFDIDTPADLAALARVDGAWRASSSARPSRELAHRP